MANSLVLHEETDCRELINRVLLANGHQVATFGQEEEALAWVQANPVDLAIVSLNDDETSTGAWKVLRGLYKDVKILLLAHYVLKDVARQALRQGADDYLLKPIEIEKLEVKINKLLSGKS
jgi:DNA-binding response OmpR family regulator